MFQSAERQTNIIYNNIIILCEKKISSQVWWRTPLIPALRQRQEDFCKFKTSLVYRGISSLARDVEQN